MTRAVASWMHLGRVRRDPARVFLILLVLCAFVATTVVPANAQAGGESGNVTGSVLDEQGQPVRNALVTLASPSGSFTRRTDDHGYFAILGIPTDTYTLSVEAPGYNTFSQTGVTITGVGTQALGSLHLESVTRVIGTVTAHSPASAFQPNQTIPQYTISGSVLQAASGKAANSNESQILLSVPGFQFDSTGDLILQGATRDQIRYQFDGVDFTDPGFSFNANNSFFNGISSVQVVPGAGDPSQGNGGAGVVNLLVKRGTYPPGGLLDLEVNARPEGQQVNFQYGAATQNGKFSDFVSYFGDNDAYQYGPWGASAFQVSNRPYLNQRNEDSDFVNNFVYRFGPDNNQSFQVLVLDHADTVYGNDAGIPLVYDDDDPNVLGLVGSITGLTAAGLTPAQIGALMSPEEGQLYTGQPVPQVAGVGNSELLKFEYDNQLNDTTSLAVRFFHSDVYNYESASGNMDGVGLAEPLYGQTSGGSRTGGNFELTRQFGPRNTVTLSGNSEFNRPNFGTVEPQQGIEALGANAIDFVKPPDPYAPVSASNPCPVTGGCYLQQFFYTTGGAPPVPPLTLESSNPNLTFGGGIRDEYQVTDKLRLDLGLRYDFFNQFLTPGYVQSQDVDTQPVPGDPTAFYLSNYGFTDEPHFVQPRFGVSYLLTPHDTVSYTYGKSINLGGNGLYASPEGYSFTDAFDSIPVNPAWTVGTPLGNPAPYFDSSGQLLCNVNVPYAIGATATSSPDYDGTVGGTSPTLQMGRPCANYGDLLRSQLDAYFPEIVNIQPAVLYNNDLSYAHVFNNGIAVKLDGYNRQAYHVQQISAPLIFNPLTDTTSFGSLVATTNGTNETTGLDFNVTLPDRPYGFTGFLSVSYINELTNTPAGADDFAFEDFEPVALPQYSVLNDIYRAGFVSPVTLHIGVSYKTKTGWRINPVLNVNDGYPYNAGSTAPYLLPGNVGVNVPNTNITDPYIGFTGGNPYFVDPANPGSVFAPTISAARGNAEGYAGTELSAPLATMDLTVEYTPPTAPRNTFGLQFIDLFNNGYYMHPFPNTNWYPVTTGVGGPLTGQNVTGALVPGYASLIATDTYPYAPYTIPPVGTEFPTGVGAIGPPAFENLPFTFRFYYQLKL